MKKIGLYFGTFNPIHIGHLLVATHMVNHTNLDELWFIVTPLNPHKKKSSLLDDHHRLEMVYRAIEDYDQLDVSDIEFGLPQPNYTVDTLVRLREKHPDKTFSLIMGEDNLKGFHKWKNYEEILKHHELLVYPRADDQLGYTTDIPHTLVNAPRIELSASLIRDNIKNNLEYRPMLPPQVYAYVDEMNFYK